MLVEALALAAESGYPDLETHVLAEAARFFLLLRDRAALEAIAERLPVEPPAMHPAGLSGTYYHTLRAETLRRVGRWAEAETAYNRVLDLYAAIGDQRHIAVFRLRRALCRPQSGDAEGTKADLSWVRERLAELSWAVQVWAAAGPTLALFRTRIAPLVPLGRKGADSGPKGHYTRQRGFAMTHFQPKVIRLFT